MSRKKFLVLTVAMVMILSAVLVPGALAGSDSASYNLGGGNFATLNLNTTSSQANATINVMSGKYSMYIEVVCQYKSSGGITLTGPLDIDSNKSTSGLTVISNGTSVTGGAAVGKLGDAGSNYYFWQKSLSV